MTTLRLPLAAVSDAETRSAGGVGAGGEPPSPVGSLICPAKLGVTFIVASANFDGSTVDVARSVAVPKAPAINSTALPPGLMLIAPVGLLLTSAQFTAVEASLP